ncbi:transporter substrate-binding domain-containing protein [uncultured Thalassospira sp.]|uniref:transporter substrate-binding domain-containing protein n=1 Tax=uncultured Thalassospira sp. TaxID=404382 RepID=UPI0030D97118|tara:strand:+ start:16660 stop:17502 length:843 start_codon:yes stop_codon:yes gene_type:complete
MKIGKLVLAVCMGLAMLGQAEAKEWTQVTLATEGAFPPWNSTKPDGTLEGYEIDLYKDLCRRMNVECTMVTQAWDGIIPALLAGKFDAIMSGMSATAKREKVISFSESYGTTGQTFAVARGSDLEKMPHFGEVFSLETELPQAEKAVEDIKPFLKGKIVGVQTASIASVFLDKYLKDTVEIREYKATEQHDLDLLAGRVDLIMASMAYLSTAAAKEGNGDMVVAGPRFQRGILGRGSSIGLRKEDTDLRDMFSKAIAEAKADGTIKKLSDKWFGFDVTPH